MTLLKFRRNVKLRDEFLVLIVEAHGGERGNIAYLPEWRTIRTKPTSDTVSSRIRVVWAWARHRYGWVGTCGVVEKNNSFLAETLSKLRFFCPFKILPLYPLLKTYDGWVRATHVFTLPDEDIKVRKQAKLSCRHVTHTCF
jgi:hypothetical protein